MSASLSHLPASPTPILDLQVPYRKAGVPPWVYGFLIGLVVGLGAIFVGVFSEVLPGWVPRTIELVTNGVLGSDSDVEIYALCLMFLPMVAVHEAGHVIADVLVGFRVVAVKIGPAVVYGQRSLVKSIDALGFVVCQIDKIRKIRSRYLWAVLGGPLANVVMAVVLALVRPHLSGLAMALCNQAATASLLLAALSLLPSTAVGLESDGYKLCVLLRGGPRYCRWLASRAMANEILKGKEIDQIKNTWLQRAASGDPDSSEGFTAAVVMYVKECELKNVGRAAEYLEQILLRSARRSERARDKWALEAAVFQAWHRADLAKADAWRRRIQSFNSLSEVNRARFNIAYHSCEGNFRKALEYWESGRKYLESSGSSALNAALLKSWLKWRSEIEQRADQTSLTQTM